MSDTLNYVDLDYIEPRYFVGSVDSQAVALNVTASVVALGGPPVPAAALVMSAGSISATATRIREGTFKYEPYTWDDQNQSWDNWSGNTWSEQKFVTLTISSTTAVGAIGESVTNAESSLFVVSTLTSNATKVKIGSAQFDSISSLTAESTYLKFGSAELSTVGFATITATPLTGALAELTVTSSVTATPTRIIDVGLSPARITWDQQADGWDEWLGNYWTSNIIGQILVGWTTTFGTTEKLKLGISNLNSSFAITSQAKVTKSASANPGLVSSFNVTATRIQPGVASLASTISCSSTPVKIHPGVAQLSVNTNFFAVATRDRTHQGVANLQAVSSTSAAARYNVDGRTQLSAFAFVLSESETAKKAQASLSSSASINVDSSISRRTECFINLTTAVSSTETRIRPGSKNLSAATSLNVVADRFAKITKNLDSTISFVASGKRLRIGFADLDFDSLTSAQGTKVINATSSLEAFDFVIVAGKVIAIDPDLILTVDSESRNYIILPDVRFLDIVQESRVNMVLPEIRGLEVPQEIRQEEVL